jgi:succinate---hydroxymethylglutarate CoA-transferase
VAFHHLCTSLGLPDSFATSPKFTTNANRVANRDELLGVFTERFAQEDLEYWRKQLRSDRFASGPVNSLREAFDHEQVRHLGLAKAVRHPVYGEVKVVGPPVRYNEMANEVETAPPLLGEHTEEVLGGELGLGEEELRDLRDSGAIDW